MSHTPVTPIDASTAAVADRPAPAGLPARAPQFITILTDESTVFPWTPPGSETVFYLRQVPDEEQQRMVKACTRKEWVKHQEEKRIDWVALNAMYIEYAVRGWARLMSAPLPERPDGNGGTLPAQPSREIAYTAALVSKLPERVQRDIIRICVGKEGGETLAEQIEAGKNG